MHYPYLQLIPTIESQEGISLTLILTFQSTIAATIAVFVLKPFFVFSPSNKNCGKAFAVLLKKNPQEINSHLIAEG